jgi:hypothetical protein
MNLSFFQIKTPYNMQALRAQKISIVLLRSS